MTPFEKVLVESMAEYLIQCESESPESYSTLWNSMIAYKLREKDMKLAPSESYIIVPAMMFVESENPVHQMILEKVFGNDFVDFALSRDDIIKDKDGDWTVRDDFNPVENLRSMPYSASEVITPERNKILLDFLVNEIGQDMLEQNQDEIVKQLEKFVQL